MLLFSSLNNFIDPWPSPSIRDAAFLSHSQKIIQSSPWPRQEAGVEAVGFMDTLDTELLDKSYDDAYF